MKTIRLNFEAGWHDISAIIFNNIFLIKSDTINFARLEDKNCKVFDWDEFYKIYDIKSIKQLRKIHLQYRMKWIIS